MALLTGLDDKLFAVKCNYPGILNKGLNLFVASIGASLNNLPLVLIWETVCIALKVVPPVVSEAINVRSHCLEMKVKKCLVRYLRLTLCVGRVDVQ
jgi:hypothetical protein